MVDLAFINLHVENFINFAEGPFLLGLKQSKDTLYF
jgi:hypothetical protein